MLIRSAKVGDGPSVFALALDFPSPSVIDENTFNLTWEQKFQDPHSFVGIAENVGEIVGYISGYTHTPFYANGSVFWIDEVMVYEAFRNQGTGKLLMAEAMDWANNQDCTQVCLASSAAGGFYERLGFKPTARYYKRYLK